MAKRSYKDDLSSTVQELSNVYEELSLFYRVAGTFASLSIEDICSHMVDEAINTIGVTTAAVLFHDDERDVLYTQAFRGVWDARRIFMRDSAVVWKAIESRKPAAFCRIAETEYREYIPGIGSLMVCPILGKMKTVGAIVVADKEGEKEFFAHDTKLLMALSAQAGLSIENALLYKELEVMLVGAIKSLVKALEATSCWTAGHTERVTEYAMAIGQALNLNRDALKRLKICSLLHDIGKIATPKEILNKCNALNEGEWCEIRKHPGVGADILGEMHQFRDVLLGIKYHHEHWDGKKSIYGLKGEEIPLMARILSVADAFDALTSDRPYRHRKTREEAVKEIRRYSGAQFDPSVVEAFLQWIESATQRYQAP